MTDSIRFERICREDCEALHLRDGIGTVSEKRLHRILKKFISERADTHEAEVGRYIADILIDDNIYEIQTSSFSPLLPKIKYYLENTSYSVTLIYPIIRNKRIIRIAPETGEILRQQTSPLHGRSADLLPELYFLRTVYPHERLSVRLVFIDAEEYRYSERMRYRRKGAYDAELFPVSLVGIEEYSLIEDLRPLIPAGADRFTATEFSRLTGFTGRRLYRALTILTSAELLRKENKTYLLN